MVANHVLQDDLDIVALQETLKQDFTDGELKEMATNKVLAWQWIPARGHSGGLAMGINTDLFEIEEVNLLQHSMWRLVRNRVSNFRYWVANVYGPAQHTLSADFITELSDMCTSIQLPVIMGGDFNLIRGNRDRNKGQGIPNFLSSLIISLDIFI